MRDNIQHSVVFFVVDDLNYLKRGGRLSGASAFFGSMLDIKPIIYASPEGALVPIEKCKGRRKALRRFVELYEERALDKENGKLYITTPMRGMLRSSGICSWRSSPIWKSRSGRWVR